MKAAEIKTGNFLRYHSDGHGELRVTEAGYGPHGHGASVQYALVKTTFGNLLLGATERGLCWLGIHNDSAYLERELREDLSRAKIERNDVKLASLSKPIADYTNGVASSIEVSLDIRGTPFQIAVWQELCAIPRGSTRSYGEIARRIGRPDASRAVGHANGTNPIAILIPCHRAIGSDGTLTGYRWGLEYKRRLLDHERATAQASLPLDETSNASIMSR